MTLTAVLLVLLSAVMHATWNSLARRTEDPYEFFVAFNAVATVIWLPVAVIAGWDDWLSGGDLLLIAASGSLQVLYFVSLAAAYREGGLTLVYPIARGTGVGLVPIAGLILFTERPTVAGWLGIATTFAGLAYIAVGNVRARRFNRADVNGRAVVFALVTGAVISSYSLVDKYGVTRVDPVVYGYGLIAASMVIQTPYVLSRRRSGVWRQLRYNGRSVLAGAILSLATYILVLIAFSQANVGYVVPLRETSIVFALIIGIIFLRERVTVHRAAAALLVALGAICIAIGG